MIRVVIIEGNGSRKLAGYLEGQMEIDLVLAAGIESAYQQTEKNGADVILAPSFGYEIPSDPRYRDSLIRWNREVRSFGVSCSFLLYTPGDTSCILTDISGGIISLPDDSTGPRSCIAALRQAAGRSSLERSFRTEYDILNRIIGEMPLACMRVESGRITWINPAMEQLAGGQPDELVGVQVSDILTILEDEPGIRPGVLNVRGGMKIPVHVHLNNEDKTVNRIALYFIEDRRGIESLSAEVRETKRACREKLWLSETLVLKMSPEGMITFANNAMLRCFGYSGSGLAGNHISILLLPTLDPQPVSPIGLFLGVANESEPTSIHIMEHLRSDGGKIYIAWTTRAFYSPAGDLTELLCIGTDMTDQTPEGEGRISTRIWRDRVIEGTDILPEVFDSILQACVEIAREGREGKPVGTAFLVGDRDAVMERSRQLILNPFYGHPPEMRDVTRKDVREMLKEYALLDGAFIVSGDGMLEAAGRYITVDASYASLPKGMGTRHSSTAAITRVTRTVGLVVSESGGRVSVIKEGKIVKVIG